MRNFSIYVRCLAVAFLFLLSSCPLFAQPGPGVQWVDRAYAYAEDYYLYPNINDDYGFYTEYYEEK